MRLSRDLGLISHRVTRQWAKEAEESVTEALGGVEPDPDSESFNELVLALEALRGVTQRERPLQGSQWLCMVPGVWYKAHQVQHHPRTGSSMAWLKALNSLRP